MPSFEETGRPVLEKNIVKDFYHIWAWRPSWSCDLDKIYTNFGSPSLRKPHIKFGFAKQFQRRRCLKIVDGRTDAADGRRLGGYTISSPCEPKGSDELIQIDSGQSSS